MSGKSNIEWTQITWNPTTGCSKISTGCKFCYAERWAFMQNKRGLEQYRNGFKLTLARNRLRDPYKWIDSKIIFVNSMSDLFHEKIPESYIKEIFQVMNELPRHKFQILTKRIERVIKLSDQLIWSKNIWLGVSVENNEESGRIQLLKEIPVSIKFISFEPLLEEIREVDLSGIEWVIIGGESGGKARRMKREWVIGLQNSCEKLKVPFFFKQWGKREFNPDKNDPTLEKKHLFHSKGGCMIDRKLFREYPIR